MKRRTFIKYNSVLSAGWLLSTATVAALPVTDNKNELLHFSSTDNGKALINPMMGWTLYFYSHNPGRYGDTDVELADKLDYFPGISSIYMRLPWNLLEPAEGEYNWTVLDTPAQRWIERGKQIALRITCSESWHKWATPKWVYDAGAKGYFYDEDKPGVFTEDGPLWEPDFTDPVFLDKLNNFLAAFAARYDNNPNVSYVDIGSFGLWGEGHTLGTRAVYDDAVKEKHIDLYKKHFAHTLLAISDDFAGATKPGTHFPIIDYALQHGVTLRDDSILVSTKRPYYHTDMMSLCWPRLPVIIEHEHYAGSKARGAWSGEKLYNSVIDYHASYMSIQATPDLFWKENRETVNRINQKLGYRIHIADIWMPAVVVFNQSFLFKVRLSNTAVAPCYPGGYICLTLKDSADNIIAVLVNEKFSIKQLIAAGNAAPVYEEVECRFTLRKVVNGLTAPAKVPQGNAKAFISVGTRDGAPVIELPLDKKDNNKRYFIGNIKLLATG